MKRVFYWVLLALLAGAVVALSILYYNVEDLWRPQNYLLSRGREWILTGDQHLFDVTRRTFDVTGLDGFKEGSRKYTPVISPRSVFVANFVTPAANRSVGAGELVLGILNGQVATAYPLRVLVGHQVVNDNSQSPPVLAYFGQTSRTAAGFVAVSNGEALSMASTGLVYWDADLLFDVSTESLFLPLTGAFVAGDRLGQRLELLGSAVLTLDEWLALFPDSRIMSPNTGFYQKRYPPLDLSEQTPLPKTSPLARSRLRAIPDTAAVVLEEGSESLLIPLPDRKDWARAEYAVSFGGSDYVVHLTETFGGAYVTDESGKLSPSLRSRRPVCAMILPDARMAAPR